MNQPWYFRSWFIILLLILFFPAGIALMWIGKQYSLRTRCIITGAFALLWVIATISPPKNKSKIAIAPPLQTVEQNEQQPLTREEKVKLLATCNSKFIDGKVLEQDKERSKNKNTLGLNLETLKKSLNDPDGVAADKKVRIETMIKEVQQFEPQCLRLYGEIFDRDRRNWHEVETQADIKYPYNVKQYGEYQRTLEKQFEAQLLDEYQISKGQFNMITTLLAPLKEREHLAKAEEFKSKLSKNPLFSDKLIKLEVLPQVEGNYVVRVSIRSSSEMTKYEIANLTMKLAKDIFTSADNKAIERVDLDSYVKMSDKNGNTVLDNVGGSSIDRSLAEKINWNNITPHTFEKLLSEDQGGYIKGQ